MKRSTDTNFARLFEDIALQHPALTAVFDDGREHTYEAMLFDVKRTADWLLNVKKVSINENICVRMNPSYEFVVACLAINYIGACWMPLGFEIPKIDNMLSDAEVRVVMKSLPEHVSVSDDVTRVNREKVHQDLNLFLVYSSGSTGQPKGIIQTQRAFLNAFEWRFSVVANGPGTRMAAYIFFIWEAFRPLLTGGALYVIPKLTLLDGLALTSFLKKNEITEIQFTPSAFRVFLPHLEEHRPSFPHLKCLWLCGEVVDGELARRMTDVMPANTDLLNLYSISEAPDLGIGDFRENNSLPIHPLTQFITGFEAELVGPKEEIVITSSTVSTKGYLGREELNQSKFSYKDSIPKYYTGDTGSFDDGKLVIKGRCDFMKKIRGYSVQIDELEQEITRITEAKNVVVEVNDSSTELFATIQRPKLKELSSIYKRLREELPSYSVPSKINLLWSDVETVHPVSGKRQRTLQPKKGETSLADLWKSELRETPKQSDDFFMMGGDSLSAVSLLENINDAFSLSLTIQQFYNHSTFSSLQSLVQGIESKQQVGKKMRQDVEDIVQAHKDTHFKPGATHLGSAERILITGATGYLGSWLTYCLTSTYKRNVTCLVRDADRWRKNLENLYQIQMPWQHIQCIEGDLTKECFGLSKADYDGHAGQFDAVVHCASLVNFSLSYSRLQETNKNGLMSLLQWCSNAHLHFISSNAIYSSKVNECNEEELDDLFDDKNSPYGCSKWVLEKAISCLGVSNTIYRLGNIGPAINGSYNKSDLQMLLLEACHGLDTGIVEKGFSLEFVPVQEVVDFIASRKESGTFNWVSNNRFPVENIRFSTMLSLQNWKNLAKESYPLLVRMLDDHSHYFFEDRKYNGDARATEYPAALASIQAFMKQSTDLAIKGT